MQVKDKTVFVSGTNRGIGAALVDALVAAGAARVYAGARNPEAALDAFADHGDRVVPVSLDITDPDEVAAAALLASDTQILVNNAGVNHNTGLIAVPGLENMRHEFEVNVFGTLSMARAFAPVLKASGGGVMVNMASISGRVCLPLMGSLSASKAAVINMSQGLRAELAGQGTKVLIVTPGAVETDMTKDFPPPKAPPADVAREIVAAIESEAEECYPGDMAKGVARQLAADPKGMEREFAKILPM